MHTKFDELDNMLDKANAHIKKGEYDLNMAQGRAEAEADIARDLDDYYED